MNTPVFPAGLETYLLCGNMGCDVINLPAQVIEDGHVCIHIVEVVGVGRVLLLSPVARQRAVQVEDMLLRLGLVVDAVKPNDLQRDGRDEAAVCKPLQQRF